MRFQRAKIKAFESGSSFQIKPQIVEY